MRANFHDAFEPLDKQRKVGRSFETVADYTKGVASQLLEIINMTPSLKLVKNLFSPYSQ